MGEALDCNKLYKRDHIEAKVLDEEKNGSRYTRLPVKTKTIYENWKVFSKEGHLMFRCNNKKAQWYLTRGLAKQLSDNSIALKFQPKGLGHHGDKYHLEEKMNICVCCGASRDLTMHHVVPEMYRKYMPTVIKSHASHDVLPMCRACHTLYEGNAFEFKQKISAEYNISLNGRGRIPLPHNRKVKKAASALLRHRQALMNTTVSDIKRNVEFIPRERIKELENIVLQWWNQMERDSLSPRHDDADVVHNSTTVQRLGDDDMSDIPNFVLEIAVQLLDYRLSDEFIEHGKFVVNELMKDHQSVVVTENGREIFDETRHNLADKRDHWPNLESFVIEWREHFVKHANPKFLSDKWKIDDSIYTNA